MSYILFALNQSHLKKKIMDFLKQSDHLNENTSEIDNDSNHIQHMDGYMSSKT